MRKRQRRKGTEQGKGPNRLQLHNYATHVTALDTKTAKGRMTGEPKEWKMEMGGVPNAC